LLNRVERPPTRQVGRHFSAHLGSTLDLSSRGRYDWPHLLFCKGKYPIMASLETSQSITRLIRAVQDGSDSAIRPLLAAYLDRLVQLARKRLQNMPGLAGYDEDLALRSFHSVYERLRDPTRPLDMTGRDDLWRLLATRTISRAIDLIRGHHTQEV